MWWALCAMLVGRFGHSVAVQLMWAPASNGFKLRNLLSLPLFHANESERQIPFCNIIKIILSLFCTLSLSLPLTRSYHWHRQYFQEVFRCSVYKLCDSIINYSPFWGMKMTSIDSLVDVAIVSVGGAILPVDEQRQMETSGIFNRTGIL